MGNGNNEKIGKFICELRKSQRLTQKDLANKLGVTDKAVSKWERGLSYPDIELLIPLAKILGVSTTELLIGEKNVTVSQEETEIKVNEAFHYSTSNTLSKSHKIKRYLFGGISIIFLIAIMTCMLCDYVINKEFTWSFIVMISVIASWLLMLPLFKSKEKIVRSLLIVLSIIIIPYLAILSMILKSLFVFSLSTSISVASLVGLWCIYGVFLKYVNRKIYAMGIIFLIMIPLVLGITYISAYFINDFSIVLDADILLQTIIMLGLSFICFGIDYFFHSEEIIN